MGLFVINGGHEVLKCCFQKVLLYGVSSGWCGLTEKFVGNRGSGQNWWRNWGGGVSGLER